MCPSVKLFLPDQILSSKLLPDRHRTAHSICVTSEEKQAVRMQMSRSEIEKRDVDYLFYLLVFSCFANGRCHETTTQLLSKRNLLTLPVVYDSGKKDFMPIITTHGQLVEFDNPFTTEESRLIYTTLYSKCMTVCVCL